MPESVCTKCGVQLPDPTLDMLTICTCSKCKARYIRKHYLLQGQEIIPEWVRLRWWQRLG